MIVIWSIALIIIGLIWIWGAHARKREIAARADAEHNALMDGDIETGTYGQFPPS